MKTVATIEARMTSSRLPGKVLFQAAGKPMLEHLVNRLKSVQSLDEIVLATTINHTDDQLEMFAKAMDICIYRGSENDVMNRVICAGESVKADILVETTGDCPILDPQLVEQAISIFNSNEVDYVSNAHVRSYPDGMDVQVLKLATLKHSLELTDNKLDHEHVTLHIRNNPDIYSKINIVSPPETFWPNLGLTLDEQSDYELLKIIIEHFEPINPLFSCREVVSFLQTHPELLEINKSVVRKGDT